MEWMIPGTVLMGQREDVEASIRQIEGMFLGGGMFRSQLASVSGVEAHDIQNWVKRGFLPSPVNKRYSMEQFCRIVTINMLRTAMSMEKICSLLAYVNGRLDDESDDLIDDTVLYFMFLRLAARARHIGGTQNWEEALVQILEDYTEPIPGAKERIDKVLRIMLTAWAASQLRQAAERMVTQLYDKGEMYHGK
jgi:DNA-binding transcriptional MerR regulator